MARDSWFSVIKKGLTAGAIGHIKHMSSKKEWLEEELTKYLKEHLNKSNPEEFVETFEKNTNIMDLIPPEELEFARKMADNDPDLPVIKENIARNLTHFDKEWVLDWIYKNKPEFYQVMATHPEREKFEAWLSQQIHNISEYVMKF